MRIVLVVWEFPRYSETFIVQKFLGLLDRGFDVHVACGETSEAGWRRFPELASRPELRERVHLTRQRGRHVLLGIQALPSVAACAATRPSATWRYLTRGWRRLGPYVVARLCLDAGVLALAPDVVHVEHASEAAKRPFVGELVGARVAVSCRGADVNYVGLERPGFYDRVWETADAVHCNGADMWERAKRRGCPPGKPHVLITPALDPSRFRPPAARDGGPLGTPERPLRLLTVARLEWKKGHEFGLAAIRELVDRGLELEYRIAGDGSYRAAVEHCIGQLGLEGRVTLLGAARTAQVHDEMVRADALVHAAVSEGFGNAVVEAQAMALPVVCTDADGLSENVEDGVTGFVVPRRDPGAIAARVELLAGDPDLRERLGRAGRERVLRLFTLERQLDAYEDFYARLAAGTLA